MWGVSHGKTIVLMTLVCSQKEGRQQSSSSRGLRTSMDEWMVRMMMMMTNFYGGTGTKSTETRQNSNPTQNVATTMVNDQPKQEPMGTPNGYTTNYTATDGSNDGLITSGTAGPTRCTAANKPDATMAITRTTTRRQQTKAPMVLKPVARPAGSTRDDDAMTSTAGRTNKNKTSRPKKNRSTPTDESTEGLNTSGTAGSTQDNDATTTTVGLTRWKQWTAVATDGCCYQSWKQHSREDDDDGDDGHNSTACNWYTRQKNQPSLTRGMPLQPTQDTRSLADDTVVLEDNGRNQPEESKDEQNKS
jgi:hypothetical protein